MKATNSSQELGGVQEEEAFLKTASAKGAWAKLVKFGFRLLYNELAFTYDAVSWLVSMGLWRDWQKTALPYVEGNHVLEIAFGTGHLLLEFERRGHRVFGIDESSHMIRLASKRVSDAKSSASIAYGQAQALPFKKESFSSVVTTFPSDFIVDPETLKNCWRVLEVDGKFIALLGARFTGKTRISTILEWLYRVTGQRITKDQADEIEIMESWLSGVFPSGLFKYKIDQVSVEESKTTLIILTKTG